MDNHRALVSSLSREALVRPVQLLWATHLLHPQHYAALCYRDFDAQGPMSANERHISLLRKSLGTAESEAQGQLEPVGLIRLDLLQALCTQQQGLIHITTFHPITTRFNSVHPTTDIIYQTFLLVNPTTSWLKFRLGFWLDLQELMSQSQAEGTEILSVGSLTTAVAAYRTFLLRNKQASQQNISMVICFIKCVVIYDCFWVRTH